MQSSTTTHRGQNGELVTPQSHWNPGQAMGLQIKWQRYPAHKSNQTLERPLDIIDVGKYGEHPTLREGILARYGVTLHGN